MQLSNFQQRIQTANFEFDNQLGPEATWHAC